MPGLTIPTTNEFIVGGSRLLPGLEARVEQALERRLKGNEQYSRDEIRVVSKLDRALFPADFELDHELFERMQLLCALSTCGLPKSYAIRSHRKLIGPLIVFAKRLAWRFTRAQLENSFDGIQEFCSWSVRSQAKQAYEIAQCRQEIADLKTQMRQATYQVGDQARL